MFFFVSLNESWYHCCICVQFILLMQVQLIILRSLQMRIETKSFREFETIPFEHRGTQETCFLIKSIYELMLESSFQTLLLFLTLFFFFFKLCASSVFQCFKMGDSSIVHIFFFTLLQCVYASC